MNIKKTVSILMSLFLTLTLLTGCSKTNNSSADTNVAIITKGSDSDFWSDFKNGAYLPQPNSI